MPEQEVLPGPSCSSKKQPPNTLEAEEFYATYVDVQQRIKLFELHKAECTNRSKRANFVKSYTVATSRPSEETEELANISVDFHQNPNQSPNAKLESQNSLESVDEIDDDRICTGIADEIERKNDF